jgi:hypothetical protein
MLVMPRRDLCRHAVVVVEAPPHHPRHHHGAIVLLFPMHPDSRSSIRSLRTYRYSIDSNDSNEFIQPNSNQYES